MTREADLLYAKLAVQNGFMSPEQLKECMRVLGREPDLSFDDYVLKNNIMARKQLQAVKIAHRRLAKDRERKEMSVSGYEIISRIGEGGLGVVYRSMQLSMNRVVALKILHRQWVDDTDFRKRFLLEARLLGKLNHPNLITVYDVGKQDWKYYFSMELVEGRTAEQMVDQEGPMDPAYATDIAIQVAKVVNYLWEHEVVHCDIKPGNILISKDDIAKLGDFGFARLGLEMEKGSEETVLGTPEYISPEQAMGQKDLDFRSDIYSLGVSIFHMVTGQPPYDGPSRVILARHVRGEVPDPRDLNKNISRDLAHVVMKMMAKEREKRYQSVEELIEALAVARLSEDPKASDSFLGRTAMFAAIKREKMVTSKLQSEMDAAIGRQRRMKLFLLLLLAALVVSVALNVVLLLRG